MYNRYCRPDGGSYAYRDHIRAYCCHSHNSPNCTGNCYSNLKPDRGPADGNIRTKNNSGSHGCRRL
jgi:hypothetical protein